MTALPSVRLLEAIADLDELRHEHKHTAPDDARYERIRDTLLYLLHALTGHAHGGEPN